MIICIQLIYFRYLEDDRRHHTCKLRRLPESNVTSNKNTKSTEFHAKCKPFAVEVDDVIADREGHSNGGHHVGCLAIIMVIMLIEVTVGGL